MFKYEEISKHEDLYSQRYRFKFNNGYGASVIRGVGTYGGREGLWELAVLCFDEDGESWLTYDTPITSDVIGYLTIDEVNKQLDKIKKLRKE